MMQDIAAGHDPRPAEMDAINDLAHKAFVASSFWAQILKPEVITPLDADRQVDTDNLCKIVDTEPVFTKIGAPRRYRVELKRLSTPVYTKDMAELKLMAPAALKECLIGEPIRQLAHAYDAKAIAAIDGNLRFRGARVGYAGGPYAVQWKRIRDELTRVSLVDGMKILVSTGAGLNAEQCLINQVTALDMQKWGLIDLGDEFMARMIHDGILSLLDKRRFMGMRFHVTTKRDLVPDGTLFFFPSAEWLGKAYMLETPQVYLERRAFFMKFMAYTLLGSTGLKPCVARADYKPGFWRRWRNARRVR